MGGSVDAMASVAFLRGINVGGHRVTKDDLIDVFGALGFTEVATFLASGNVIFGHDGELDQPAEAERIGDALAAALGYAVPTTIRTADELISIAGREPFPADVVAATGGKHQVVLLFEPASAATVEGVLALETDDDRLAFGPRELHWLPSGGMSESALDLDRITDLVGVNTIRTANTIRRLVARL